MARPSRAPPIARKQISASIEGGIHPPNPASVAGSVIKSGTIGTLTVQANNVEVLSRGLTRRPIYLALLPLVAGPWLLLLKGEASPSRLA